jgi:SAM-dependent methyltransferase
VTSTSRWPLPKKDYWSTPFAEALLRHLDLVRGATILDVTCGHGILAFYLAEQVGSTGQVLGIDLSEQQVARARAIQGPQLPWLRFECHDMRALPPHLPAFDRITGNLSVMFFRPNRLDVIRGLVAHLKPAGQLVLTFPSLGTFDSLWRRIDQEMAAGGLVVERQRLAAYVGERPSAEDCRRWLEAAGLERIEVTEWPLEVATESGPGFLYHPLLRGGFLDDVYECFDDGQEIGALRDTPSFVRSGGSTSLLLSFRWWWRKVLPMDDGEHADELVVAINRIEDAPVADRVPGHARQVRGDRLVSEIPGVGHQPLGLVEQALGHGLVQRRQIRDHLRVERQAIPRHGATSATPAGRQSPHRSPAGRTQASSSTGF